MYIHLLYITIFGNYFPKYYIIRSVGKIQSLYKNLNNGEGYNLVGCAEKIADKVNNFSMMFISVILFVLATFEVNYLQLTLY